MKTPLKIVFLDFTGTIDAPEPYKATGRKSAELFRGHEGAPKKKLKGKDLIQYFKEKQKLREKRGLHPQNTFYDNIDDGENSHDDSNWGRKFDKRGQYDFASQGFHQDDDEAQRAHVREHGYGSNIHDTYEDGFGNMIPLFGGHDDFEDRHAGLSANTKIYKPYKGGVSLGGFFTTYKDEPNKESVKLLRQLLDKTGAKIVYSSTRRYSGWKKCADYVGLPYRYSLGHDVFGVTPELETKWFSFGKDMDEEDFGGTALVDAEDPTKMSWKEREKEIKKWLTSWNGRKLSNFIILDDDPMRSAGMKKHWVPSIEKNGFKQSEYKEALKILSRNNFI